MILSYFCLYWGGRKLEVGGFNNFLELVQLFASNAIPTSTYSGGHDGYWNWSADDGVTKSDLEKKNLKGSQHMLITLQFCAREESAITTSSLSLLRRVHIYSETKTAACSKCWVCVHPQAGSLVTLVLLTHTDHNTWSTHTQAKLWGLNLAILVRIISDSPVWFISFCFQPNILLKRLQSSFISRKYASTASWVFFLLG